MIGLAVLYACTPDPDANVRDPSVDAAVDPADSAAAWVCFADADADGWGVEPGKSMAHSCGAGWSDLVGDCDDADASSYPGGVERCDGADNDCDGAVDSPVPADADIWFGDADGDGYGDAADSSVACSAPVGFVDDPTDCDDTRNDAFPGGEEVCEDGADNDCAGDGDGRCRLVGEVDPALVSDGTWFGTVEGAAVPGRRSFIRDVDTDGRAEAIVEAFAVPWRTESVVAIHVLPDALDGGSVEDAVSTIMPAEAGGLAFDSRELALTSDLDGDGCSELVIGGSGQVTEGSAWVFSTCIRGVLDETDALIRGDGDGALRFGTSPTLVVDSDGDAVAELLVAASSNVEEDGTWYREVGRAYLFRDPLATLDAGDAEVTFRLPGNAEWMVMGEAACSSDLDGDGLSEVVLGAPGYGSGELLPSWAPGGAVFVAFAPFVSDLLLVDEYGAPASNVAVFASDMTMFQYRLGYAVACDADLDGDGTADLAYSDPFVDDGAGRVYVTQVTAGRSELPGASGWTITGDAAQLYLGAGSLLASDLDGDGAADLTIGGLGEGGSGTSWVFYAPGSSPLTTADADATIEGTQYAATGDIDGDGIDDLLVGVPEDSTYAHWSGAAYVLLGGSLTPQ